MSTFPNVNRELWGEVRQLMGMRYGLGSNPHFFGAQLHEACQNPIVDRNKILDVADMIGGVVLAIGLDRADEVLALTYSRVVFSNMLGINRKPPLLDTQC